jgi:hypothetical protein
MSAIPDRATSATDAAIDAKAVEVAASLPPMTPAAAARIAQNLIAATEDLARRDAA